MKVAVIYNKKKDVEGVINVFGMQNMERYNPKTVELVAAALEKGGHNVRVIDGNINVIEQLQAFMPRVVQGEQPGMVFNMAYGLQGVSRYTHIPSLLEMLGIPYVGSSPAGHGIALDKVTTKVMIEAAGLPTAPFWVFYSAAQIPDVMPYPVITKPKMEAVSMGIEVIHDKEALKESVTRLVEEFKQPILVEQFIPGREFAVGLLGNNDPEILPVLEIDLQGDPNAIQSLDDKKRTPRGKICPALIDEKLAGEMGRLTKETFHTLGIYDFCRVDYRMDDAGKLYILELNSMASLGSTGSYVHAAQVAGYSFDTLINRMLDVAVERYFGQLQPEQIGEQQPLIQNLYEKTRIPLHSRLRSHLRGNLTTMEDSLAKMVEINSYVRNIDGVNAFGQWISNQLATMGFQREVFARAEFGNMLYFTNHTSRTNDVLLIGQLDNPVHFRDFVPFSIDRGKIFGTGISRGKGGLAVLLGALQALRYTRSLKKIKCGILLVSDESTGGRSSRPILQDLSTRTKRVLGLRGAGPSGELVLSASGQIKFLIELNQTEKTKKEKSPKHDLLSFVLQKVGTLNKMDDEDERVSVIVTDLETKGIGDQSPDYASLTFQLSYHDASQREELEAGVYKLFEVSPKRPIRVHITRTTRQNPLTSASTTEKLFDQIAKLAKKLEVRVQKSHSEIPSILSNVNPEVPVIEGLGPVTHGYGTKGSYVVRDSILDRAVLLAYTIQQTSVDFSG